MKKLINQLMKKGENKNFKTIKFSGNTEEDLINLFNSIISTYPKILTMLEVTINDRGKQYGDTICNHKPYLGKTTGLDIILDCIDLKLNREYFRHNLDNLLDICGYILLYFKCQNEKRR